MGANGIPRLATRVAATSLAGCATQVILVAQPRIGDNLMQVSTLEIPIRRSEEKSQRMVLEQMPQVKYIARRIHEHLPKHVPYDDLVQAGMVGLIDALQKFDSDKNVKFTSYAKFRIRGAILDSLRELDWSPRDLRRKSRQIDMVTQHLQTELGRTATEPELARALGLSLQEFHALINEIRGLEIGSLQCESNDDGQETDLAQSIPGAGRGKPAHAVREGPAA